jgi:hypothetical protein
VRLEVAVRLAPRAALFGPRQLRVVGGNIDICITRDIEYRTWAVLALFDGLTQIYLSAGTNALQYSSIAATTTMAFEALPLLYCRRCRIVQLLCCRSESELVLLELLLNYLLQHLLL